MQFPMKASTSSPHVADLVQDGVKLSEIQQLNRLREPDETADQLMLDADLWYLGRADY